MEALAMTLELPGQEPIPVAIDPPRRSPAAELGLARTVIEATVRVGLFLVLVAWCFWIARPFLVAVLWGLILAIAVHPGFCRLCDLMAGRRRTVAGLMTLLALLMLIGPLSLLTLALIDNIGELAARLTAGVISVPPPPPRLAALPLVGEAAERLWSLASVNFLAALEEVRPQLASLGRWLLRLVAGVSLGALNFMLAVVVAGLLLAHDEQGGRLAHAVARKLAGARGPMLALLAEQTVRNVARGVLGTALIQSTLAGLGLVLADVPGAAILTLVCFLLCVVQIGPAILLIAAVAYLFSTAPMTVAVLFTVWSVFVALVDNLLRPILIGRGSEVPLAVILTGVLGGLLAHGLIGLFVGPIVLALGYELFRAWLATTASQEH
jgi:predicted PurR-regulated permease PerM